MQFFVNTFFTPTPLFCVLHHLFLAYLYNLPTCFYWYFVIFYKYKKKPIVTKGFTKSQDNKLGQRDLILKSSHIMEEVWMESGIKMDSGWTFRNQRSNPQKARLTNDARYQDSSEITLDCNKMYWSQGTAVKGYFILYLFRPGQSAHRAFFYCQNKKMRL